MSRVSSPASFAQQRLWFLEQLEPGTAAYNLPRAFRIEGPLDVEILTRAFQTVVQRHASLRTVFDSVDGEARQVVLSTIDVEIPVVDLTGYSRSPSAKLRLSALPARKARNHSTYERDPCFAPSWYDWPLKRSSSCW